MKKAIFTNAVKSSKSLYFCININYDSLEKSTIMGIIAFVFTICLFGGFILLWNIAEGNITLAGVLILFCFAAILYGMFRIKDNHKQKIAREQKWEELFSH